MVKSETYVKNSAALAPVLDSLTLAPSDLLVSPDVVSLYTKVPVQQTLQWLKPLFPESTLDLFRYVLASTYCMFNGLFYKQSQGVAMGSPLSSIVADFFMEKSEQHALESAPLKPSFYR